VKIEGAELTFINVPMKQPELWAWGLRDGYTVGLVELHTDAGVTGLGEVVVAMGPDVGVIRAMFDQMAAQYIGESPLDTERIITKIMADGWYSFERTAGLVLGGLDMACWDAAGKFLGQPVSRLMGGQVRTSFDSMYFVPADDDIGVMVERAVAAVKQGFSTIYYKVGIGEERDVELVLRTPDAATAIASLCSAYPAATVGAGTVLDAASAYTAVNAGARFLVSPVVAEEVLREGHRHGVAVIPGACTPTEIQTAMELGAEAVKLFPASAFGIGYLRAIATALPHVPFVPTGGITAENARSWLESGAVAVGIGGDLTAGTPAQARDRAAHLLARLAS
jgi:2-dehydro-3-deoxyphosphogluconate aldolase / (4S)-4-hydroxy-2-oxoglutarate aldolase